MKHIVSTALLAAVLLVGGCDSDPQEELVTITVSGTVSAEATSAPLDSVHAVLVPPPNVGQYIVDADSTGTDGRYELTAQTPVLPEGVCQQAGGIFFIKEGYQDRIVAFVPPAYADEAGDDDESIRYVTFTCDAQTKSIDVALFDEAPDDTTAGG